MLLGAAAVMVTYAGGLRTTRLQAELGKGESWHAKCEGGTPSVV